MGQIKSQKFLSSTNPNIWAWVTEKGFSIGTGGCNLMCNPFFVHLIYEKTNTSFTDDSDVLFEIYIRQIKN